MYKTFKPLLIIVSLVLLFVQPANAGILSPVSDAIANGGVQFVNRCSDNMMNMSVYSTIIDKSGQQSTTSGGITDIIINMGSFSPNPYQFDEVITFREYIIDILLKPVIKLILVLIAILTLLVYLVPSAAAKLHDITGINSANVLKTQISKIALIIGIIVLSNVFVFVMLALNDSMTKQVFSAIINQITPTPDNFILYFMISMAYFLLSFFYAWRILVIFLYAIFAELILLCLVFDSTRKFGENITKYFIQTVFFQFIMMCYFVACIMIISLFPYIPQVQISLYLVMVLASVIIAFRLTWGVTLFNKAVFIGKSALLAL